MSLEGERNFHHLAIWVPFCVARGRAQFSSNVIVYLLLQTGPSSPTQPIQTMRQSPRNCEPSEYKMVRAMIDAKMFFSNNENAYMMSMVQRSMQRRQSMWDFHNSAISTIAFGTATQQNSIEFTNALNAKLHFQKLEVDILAKEQAATAVDAWEAHNRYMLAQHCLQEVDVRGGGYQKEMRHREIEISRHSPPLAAIRGHPSLNVSFDTTPHRLHNSHVMAPVVPRAPLFQKIPHNDRRSEITSANLGPSDLNYSKEHHSKKLAPVPDATHSMPLLAVEVGGTVVNSVIGGKRKFQTESHPALPPYAPPTSKKMKKKDYPDDMPQRPLSSCKYEVNNILFDFNVGLFLMRFDIFLHAGFFSLSKHVKLSLRVFLMVA